MGQCKAPDQLQRTREDFTGTPWYALPPRIEALRPGVRYLALAVYYFGGPPPISALGFLIMDHNERWDPGERMVGHA
jgi:hypothetical protein